MSSLEALNDRFMRQKGVAPPFRTRRIRFARIRTSPKGGREFVLPSLFGVRGDYIVPWNYLPELTTLCVHDRILWEALGKEKGLLTPSGVRARAREVMSSGILGAAIAEKTQVAVRAEGGRRHVLHARILADLLAQIDADAAAALAAGAGPVLRPEQMQALLAAAAAPMKLDPAVLFDRAGEIAAMLAPVGFADGGSPDDRLRRLYESIGNFAESVDMFGVAEPAETQFGPKILLQVADTSYDQIGAMLQAIDADLGDPRSLLTSADRRAALQAKIAELEWVAEGWDLVLAAWNDPEIADRQQRRELAIVLADILPPLAGQSIRKSDLPRGLAELVARDILGLIGSDGGAKPASRAMRGAA